MKLTFLTPGTGSYYCGACMRDNALAIELHKAGEDVAILPMYLPLMLDEEPLEGLKETPIFFGGINMYLQQKLALFRKTPAFIDRLLNRTSLLRWAARHSHMTSAREHGKMCLEMLEIEESGFRKEFEKLLVWLEEIGKPEVVCLSTALQAGLADEIKKRLNVPIILFFQGEDSFLDGLPEPFRSQCWNRMGERLASADMLVSPCRFYSRYMEERLGLSEGTIEVMHNGIKMEGYELAEQSPEYPTIGYLARMCREKGLEVLVDGFIRLRKTIGREGVRLRIAGAMTAGDIPLVKELKARIHKEGLDEDVDWLPNISREEKISFLQSLTLFSVPVTYPEAFGLYVLEAIACGVPVVQPEMASFPEIIESTGGGTCVPRNNPKDFAEAWDSLLNDPERLEAMRKQGREKVEEHFSSPQMSKQFLQLTRAYQPTN
ncbi:MAG: glycosyltransferase family 4 protein [Opitutales bacterium]|nr:glycosyltransferase family 4 protein [Opitutales bacterium]MDG2166414.1 glycosyltransferase family 4 protein [Opitutales bacterium]